MRPIADYHTHTRWSHASGNIADNLRAAAELGLEAIGIAEHGPNLLFVGVPRRRWPRLERAVREAGGPGKPRLLFNIEANVISLEGDLDIPPPLVDRLDMLLVGLHPRVAPSGMDACWAFFGLRWLALLSRRHRHLLYDSFTRALINCVQRHKVDILVHPGYGLPIDSRELARACARRGTRLEINCRHADTCAPDIQRAAAVEEVEFVIGSDAHAPGEVGRFERGIELVRRLGLDRERIVNVNWKDKGR
jgi:putative hydrolase